MKKTVLVILLIFIANISLNLLRQESDLELTTSLAAKAIIKLGLVFFTLWAIIKQRLTYPSLNKPWVWALFSLVLICLSYYQMHTILQSTVAANKPMLNFIFLVNCLGTGFFEELLFRVFLFSALFYVAYKSRPPAKRYWLSIFWASLWFGVLHFVNFLKDGYDIYSFINQAVFAFFIGMVFQGLLIRFNSVLIIGTLHGLVNYFGSYRSNLEIPFETSPDSFTDWALNLVILGGLLAVICIPLTHLLVQNKLRAKEDTP